MAANITVEQPTFSASPIQIGQNFTFSFSLNSAIVVSHAIVDMEIRDLNGDLLMQQFVTGQNYTAGQTQSYAWNGTIPSGQTLSVPFAAGTYTVSVNVFSGDWSSQYMATTVAETFTVGSGGSGTTSPAANLAVQQPSFSPSEIQIGQNFTFNANVSATTAVSNAIVDMEIRDQKGDLLLQQFTSGQNFTPGQTTPYTWAGSIPTGQTLSVPFSPGIYTMTVTVYSSDWSSTYMASTNAGTFLVNAGGTVSPNVGAAAVAPIPAPAGTGNTYYVSDPSNASVNQANLALVPAGAIVFTTLQAASNATQPGDTVLVMNGTYQSPHPSYYYNAVATITNSGSASGGYITYAPYPGAHPILTTANATMYDVIQIEASYIVIEGFEIVGSAQTVTLGQANQAAQTEENVLSQEASAGQPATYPSGTTNDITNGNCIVGQNVTHVMILNNLVHDCSAAGIDFETSDYTTVEANTVYNSSWWTMYDTSGISLHRSLNSDSSTAYKNFVLDNISYDNANTQPNVPDLYANDVNPGSQPSYPTDGEGIIIDTNQQTNDGSPYLGRTLVAGNITYDNGGGGIQMFQSYHVDVINNIAYLNNVCPVSGSVCGPASVTVHGSQTAVTGNYYGQLFSTSGQDVNIYNNILYAPANKYIYTNSGNTSTVVENNNIFFTQSGPNLMNYYQPAAQDISSDPLFSDSAAPETNNFILSASSPGINAGISYSNQNLSVPALLPLTVTNGAVDIGAGP